MTPVVVLIQMSPVAGEPGAVREMVVVMPPSARAVTVPRQLGEW